MKIDARLLVRLYPRAWRERYGEELVELLGDRVGLRGVVNLMSAAANEWMVHMTGNGYWNDQAKRTTRALAQAASAVILFQTFVPPIVSALIGERLFGASSFGAGMLYGFVSSLLQSCVTLGPVALVCAAIPWREIPYRRLGATTLAAIIAFRIASHVAWGPVFLLLTAGACWIASRTADTPHVVEASIAN